MKDIEYRSVLAPYIHMLLDTERVAGAVNTHLPGILKDFDEFAYNNGLTESFITEEIFNKWLATRKNESERTIYGKVSVLRKLIRLMNRRGCKCYVPRPMGKPISTYTPYVFTEDELASIWKAIDSTRVNKNKADSTLIALPVIYRLLYSAGLRIGEALAIKNIDVDLTQGTILIHATKRESERLIVLHPSMKSVLEDYIHHRNRMPLSSITAPDHFLFIKLDGTPISIRAVYDNFRRLLKKCGIDYGGRAKGPCVHSFRHTYAVHSLAGMTRRGMNIYAALPILSASMGHHSLKATEYYVRLTRMTYGDIERASSAINAFIYPIKYQTNEN